MNWLLIGSGIDLNGRRMAARIDSGHHGRVVRINKPYGHPLDTGTRCDLLVTRFPDWPTRFFGAALPATLPTLCLNTHTGTNLPADWPPFTQEEHRAACAELGHPHASAGMLAAFYLLNRGQRHIAVIGFGYHPHTGWAPDKRYPDGTVDTNPAYNWPRERAWLQNNHITLL